MVSRVALIALLLSFVTLGGLGCTDKTASTATTHSTSQSEQDHRAVSRIVFVDKENCCDCTRKRTEETWAALQEALQGPTQAVPVERIHTDTESEKVKPYQEKRAMLAVPALYFMDEKNELVEMLQGEITAEQVVGVLLENGTTLASALPAKPWLTVEEIENTDHAPVVAEGQGEESIETEHPQGE